jgi:hypothetical protein
MLFGFKKEINIRWLNEDQVGTGIRIRLVRSEVGPRT